MNDLVELQMLHDFILADNSFHNLGPLYFIDFRTSGLLQLIMFSFRPLLCVRVHVTVVSLVSALPAYSEGLCDNACLCSMVVQFTAPSQSRHNTSRLSLLLVRCRVSDLLGRNLITVSVSQS